MATATLPRHAPGYRAAPRHPVRHAFDDVGPALWTCSRCGGRGTYSNPLDVVAAEAGQFSHVFVHRGACS